MSAVPKDRQVLFIYTNSYDFSSDVLVRKLGNEAVFRFNLDLWQEYAIEIAKDGFRITNRAGRTVEASQVAKFLWRKPLTNQQLFPDRVIPRERVFEEEELAYAMREVFSRMYLDGRAVLIDPISDSVAGKFIQLDIAKAYFSVPPWRFVSAANQKFEARESVVKSLTSLRTGNRSVMYTTRVQEDQLSPTSPWFIQDCVEAEADVTVVVVRDAILAFELNRGDFPDGVIDWRRARALEPSQRWKPHSLPASMAAGVAQFMSDMSLHYGRLDFLLSGGTYWFLEVNPNGEWGWLDERGDAGILDKLAAELSPDTPCHPLPNPRMIRLAGQLAQS